MAFDRFLIAPFSEGLRTDLEPWQIPEESFAELYNAYVWRGRVRKRFGGRLMGTGSTGALTAPLLSRFRINLGTTPIAAPIALPGNTFNPGQQVSVGDNIFTVITVTAGANAMLSTNAAATGTITITAGPPITATFTATIPGIPAGTAIFFYPGLPVMGLTNYATGPVNDHPSIGFDTRFVYQFTNGWDRLGVAQNVIFHGQDYDFFWTCNWTGIDDAAVVLFVTNYNATVSGNPAATDDPMWYYNAVAAVPWVQFAPQVIVANGAILQQNIVSAQIILPFKDRLVLLNTIEQTTTGGGSPTLVNTQYKARCRYSHNGSPLDSNAFIQVNNTGFDGGGYIDAATDEAIVSAEYIKDRLIVYFERSTWELAYTGNQVLPFLWQQINTELGAESVFATVPFDKAVLGIGNTGVHACSGANVERIDTKIPDQIFQIANKSEGVQRVVGIRDYYVEMVYWTFPNSAESATFKYPNQVLIYNYKTNSWAFNDDCITMFGYYEQQLGTTWSSLTMPWSDNNSTWGSGVQQSEFRQVIAGNQQGYVFIVDPDTPNNAPVMSITNIVATGTNNILTLTVIDHTLQTQVDNNGDYIYITNCQGVTGINDNIYPVQAVVDSNTIQIAVPGYASTYSGGGSITRVSMIDILTKQFNPYMDQGRDVYIAKIDFGVLATSSGELTVDYSPSATPLSMVKDGATTGTLMGTSVLQTYAYPDVPIEYTSTRLWHPLYFQVDGECIQFEIYLSQAQITNTLIAFQDFWLEGMVLHCMPVRSRLS
ncbi:MAG: hypothetical protein ABSB40_12450 [Nitrososphaeria archaeon]